MFTAVYFRKLYKVLTRPHPLFNFKNYFTWKIVIAYAPVYHVIYNRFFVYKKRPQSTQN